MTCTDIVSTVDGVTARGYICASACVQPCPSQINRSN